MTTDYTPGADSLVCHWDRDALTGLLPYSAARAIKNESAVVLLDIDRLIRLNHECGHELGDRYLRKLAACLEAEFSPFPVYRYGGDEFVIEVLDPLDEAGVPALIDRAAACFGAPIEGTDMRITVTAGISLNRRETALVRLDEADLAQFWAKSLGVSFVIFQGARYRDRQRKWRSLPKKGRQPRPPDPWLTDPLDDPPDSRALLHELGYMD